MKNKMIIAILLFAGIIMISACGGNPTANESAASSILQAQEAGEAAPAAGDPSDDINAGEFDFIKETVLLNSG